jgi:hypothetical protein
MNSGVSVMCVTAAPTAACSGVRVSFTPLYVPEATKPSIAARMPQLRTVMYCTAYADTSGSGGFRAAQQQQQQQQQAVHDVT